MKKTGELTVEQLKHFLTGASCDSRGGGEAVQIPFGIRSEDFLNYAEYDFQQRYDHHLINCLSNVKRAFDCQMDSLLVAFGLYSRSKREDWRFPRKTQVLRKLGIVAPEFLDRINKKRNDLEHRYVAPSSNEEVRDAIDFAKMFLGNTDKFVDNLYCDCQIVNDGIPDLLLNVKLDYEKGKVSVDTSKGSTVVDANSEEYLDYLALLLPFLDIARPLNVPLFHKMTPLEKHPEGGEEGNKQKLDSHAGPIADTDLKSKQVIREGVDSEFMLSDMEWTILEAAQGSFGNATSTMELAKTAGLENATVYRECVILRDTGYVDFTDDSHGMAMLKITGQGLLALRERDRLTR